MLLSGQNLARAADLFVDVTKAAGLTTRHENGFSEQQRLMETMCGGAGWIDYDGDGRFDIYIVQGHSQSDRAAEPGDTANVLWRNLGEGRFADVTEAAGVGDRSFGTGLAVGDYDNDGDSDLYVTNFRGNVLYRNEGDGRFRDVSKEAGVAGKLWSASAAFLDVNRDGLLDIYVANYVYYDAARARPCTGNPKKIPSYCHPNVFDGAPDSLYINRGSGRFEDVSRQAGIALSGRILSKGLGVLPSDYDGDGDVDIFVANDSVANFLWRNLGDGRFEDAALEAGVALNSNGEAEACMGIDSGDVNGDGRLDYFITNFADETDTLYLGEGDGFLFDGTHRSGLAGPTFAPLGFGTRLVDIDLDGHVDIYVARGHVEDSARAYPDRPPTFRQTDQLFLGDGHGKFRDVSKSSGAWFQEKHVGRALAGADYDNDGDIDFFVLNSGGPCVLLRNTTVDEKAPSWVGLSLEGNGPSPRDAYGAQVTVTRGGGGRVVAEVQSARSYQAANDPRLVFGLGSSKAPLARVEVRWPDGLREEFRDLASGRYHEIVRGKGRALRALRETLPR